MNEQTTHASGFDQLESAIIIGFSMYAVLFLLGAFVVAAGLGPGSAAVTGQPVAIPAAIALAFGILVVAVQMTAKKWRWHDAVHHAVDGRVFGILEKSNLVIFDTLANSLGSREREALLGFPAERKHEITTDVLSGLAGDNQLIDALVKRGIFQTWFRYWLSIDGTCAFSLLAAVSFAAVWLRDDNTGIAVFTGCAGLAVLHLLAGMSTGRSVLRKTEAAVGALVTSHKEEIAVGFRAHLPRPDEGRLPEITEPGLDDTDDDE